MTTATEMTVKEAAERLEEIGATTSIYDTGYEDQIDAEVDLSITKTSELIDVVEEIKGNDIDVGLVVTGSFDEVRHIVDFLDAHCDGDVTVMLGN